MSIDFSLFRNLKPVELLYLLHQADEEYFDEESSLCAILAFFFQKGYIFEEKSGRRVDLTISIIGLEAIARGELKEYEADILKIIKNRGSDSEILQIIKNLESDLLEYFIKKKFLEREIRPFWFFFKKERIIKNENAQEIIKKLYSLREDLTAIFDDGRIFTSYHFSFMPIFPGIMNSDEFREYFEETDSDDCLDLAQAISWSERICSGQSHVVDQAHSFTV